ncbi:MAG TPA: DUF2188 domain-containing protein [Solirubrobacter sp.]|jgi:hypothetical protein|nr:DUF2188 domain-containing protein [Solirubrobacter sp.]
MTDLRSVHVVPDQLGRWRVQREGDDRPLSEHGTATEAERAAAMEPTTEIVVHDRYCRVRREPVRRTPRR